MSHSCTKYLAEAIELFQELERLSNEARSQCSHEKCQLLFGMILDSSFKFEAEASSVLQDLIPKE